MTRPRAHRPNEPASHFPEGRPPDVTASPTRTLLARELRIEMWLALAHRLRDGAPLYANGPFVEALLEIYEQITGQAAPESVRREIADMVEMVNRQYPETYLARGVMNGVTRAFEEGVRRKSWDLATIQSKGARALKRFREQDSIRDLLEEANLSPGQISVVDCVQRVIDQVAPRRDGPVPEANPAPPAYRPDLAPRSVPDGPAPGSDSGLDAEAEAAVEAGDVDAEVARARLREGERRRSQLERREYEKVPDRLDAFVERGVVTQDEADQLRQLRAVDERVRRGDLGEQQAGEIRNSILGAGVRDNLERKVREAVADSVRYLQVFEAMKKIDARYYDALLFLIQHKNLVTAADGAKVDLGPVVHGLLEDVDLLERVIDIMERKDQELRMISVRLHPYNAIMGRGLDRIGNMTIEEEFVDDLGSLGLDAMSERLASKSQVVRVRPAADMRCLISLIDHVTKRTPFRKELRLLRIAKQLEEFYKNTSDLKEARHQAEGFLKRRLRRLFPDMSAEEALQLKQRSAEMMGQIEQRILDERRAEVEARRVRSVEAGGPTVALGEDVDEIELSADEIKKGVQVGRVEMRIAGGTRRLPTRIMPDPEDGERMVIVTRDRVTGDLQPALRRGQMRYVERTRDGYWAEAR